MNWRAIFLGMAVWAVQRLVSGPVWEEVEALVHVMGSQDLSGEDRRAAVLAELRELEGAVGDELRTLPSTLVNLAVEAAVAKVKAWR